MARYYYEARNKKGRAVTGEMSAVSEEELYQKLKTEGKYLIDAGKQKLSSVISSDAF